MTARGLPNVRQVALPVGVIAARAMLALTSCAVYPRRAVVEPAGYRVGVAYPAYRAPEPYGAEHAADRRDWGGYH